MKHVTKRHHFHTGAHLAGTLCQTWDATLGLIRKPSAGFPDKYENVRLKEGDWLHYLGEDERDPAGKTYIRCMSKHGVCWVFPNTVTVIIAVTEEPDGGRKYSELNSLPTLPRFEKALPPATR